MKLAFCQCTYYNDFDLTLECVKRAYKYVDYVIIVEDGTLTEEQRKKLQTYPNLILKKVEFKDNIPEFRNQYLVEAKKLKVDWVIVSDPDEIFNKTFWRDIRKIIQWAEANGYNMLGVNCRERFEAVEWLDDLDKLKEVPGGYRESNFWKNLVFKLYPDLRYEGVGKTKSVHETWYSSVPWRAVNLPKKYWYEHRKSALKIWRNAARNLFIGGGGDNVGDLNPYWTELRQICNELGITTWREFENYLKRGKVDKKLKQWLINALQAIPTNWGVETRETAKYYFAMHPDEVTPEIKKLIETVPQLTPELEVEAYVTKCYFEVLGRHPDEKGKKHYTRAILEGLIKPEDLPKILRASPEFREKFPDHLVKEEEKVKVSVPVDVNVRITNDLVIQALRRSDTYWNEIKPLLIFAKKWEAYLAIQKKAETGGKGLDTHPPETFIPYVEKMKKFMPPEKYPHILEVGAGAGDETKAIMDAGYKVTGITFGEENIQHAKEEYGIDLLEMDMHNLLFPEGIFDGAVIIHTFEHALAPHLVVGELRYVLRDGARVYLVVPDPRSEKTIWHTNLLTKRQIIDIFKYWGFKLIHYENHEYIFEKLPNNHPDFKHNWGYIRHIYHRRRQLS